MVGYSRGAPDTRRVRRLKAPRQVDVETTPQGIPVRLRLDRRWHDVVPVRRPWRIDQHWWRTDVISRLYYRLAPVERAPLTLYLDLVNGAWYLQDYA